MAIAGLILSIAGLLGSFISFSGTLFGCWLAVFAWPMAITGLILSAVAMKQTKKGIAIAGLVIGIVATVMSTVTFFTCGLCVICATAADNAVNDAYNSIIY